MNGEREGREVNARFNSVRDSQNKREGGDVGREKGRGLMKCHLVIEAA